MRPSSSLPTSFRRVQLLLLMIGACSSPSPELPYTATSVPDLRLVEWNDNRHPAGTLVGDTLVVELRLARAAWTPRGSDGPRIPIVAIADGDGVPTVPGPYVRTTVGTPVRYVVRNEADVEVEVSGLVPGEEDRTASVAAGATHVIEWTPARAVSSAYSARASDVSGPSGASQGVLVVDPAGSAPHPDERVLLISSWGSAREPNSLSTSASWKQLVNGRSWPHTERLDYAVGDTVRWRVISSSGVRHPMHLHGFYFDVTSAGDHVADTIFAPGTRSPVVTHLMANFSAMTLLWVPTTPGNWLFHCHLLRHMGPNQQFVADTKGRADASVAMADGMAGLITGIHVRPAVGDIETEPAAMRRLDLWTGETRGGYGDASRLAFVLQQGDVPPLPDSTEAPSSPIVLQRDEPVEIMIHNRLSTPLSLHWHGIELRSAYDGVGHWSGMPGMTRPPIPAGDSARVLLKPPRAGTFIYHTHGEEGNTLSQGLYGALVVLPPGETWDADRDRVFLMGAGGGTRDTRPALNGLLEPASQRFTAGHPYRLRFIQISADESKIVELLTDGEPATWRPLAKDGADLSVAAQVTVPARFRAEVGETFDFAWTPAGDGVHQLVVKTVGYPLDFEYGPTQTVALAVGNVAEGDVADAHDGFGDVMSISTIITIVMAAVAAVLLLVVGLLVRYLLRLRRRRRLRAASAT